MNTFKNVLRCAAGAACLFLYVWGYVIYEHTLVGWWLPAAGAAVLVLFTSGVAPRMWAAVTCSGDRSVNLVCHAFAVGAIGWFALLGGNYFGADAASARDTEVTVAERIAVTRSKYNRRGRRMMKSGTYKVYYLRLTFDDGRTKKVPVSLAQYNRARTGGRMSFHARKGLLGFTVLRD